MMSEWSYKQTVYLGKEAKRMVALLGRKNPSNTIKMAVKHLYHQKIIVFKLKNNANKRVFFGIDDAMLYHDIEIVQRIESSMGILYNDIDLFGPLEFEAKIMGSFGTMNEAYDYMTFLVNSAMDNGEFVYNDEIYSGKMPKTITIPIKLDLYLKFVAACNKAKISVTDCIIRIIRKFVKTQGF
jgi:hypothetical protein